MRDVGKAVEASATSESGLLLSSVGERGGKNGELLHCSFDFIFAELESAKSSIIESGKDIKFPSGTNLVLITEGSDFRVEFETVHSWG